MFTIVKLNMHGGEADDREPRRTRAAPAARRARVDVAGVEHPDDEGPDLLGVEAPVAAPRVVRPDRAGDEREGPEDEADDREAVGEGLERVAARAACGGSAGPVLAAATASLEASASAAVLRSRRACISCSTESPKASAKSAVASEATKTWMTSQTLLSGSISGDDLDVERQSRAAEQQHDQPGDERAEEAQVVAQERPPGTRRR